MTISTDSFLITFSLILLVFGLNPLLERLWRRVLNSRQYRWFIMPGIIIHELSHAVACVLTGIKISKIDFFASFGGYVEYQRAKKFSLKEVFVSLAPFFGGLAALALLSFVFGFSLPQLSAASFSAAGLIVFAKAVSVLVIKNYLVWQFWFFIYLATAIIICLLPSRQDLHNAVLGIVVIFFILWVLVSLGYGLQVIISFCRYLNSLLFLEVVFQFLAILVSLPFVAFKLALVRLRH